MAKGGGRRERHTTSPGGDGELLLLGEEDCNGILPFLFIYQAYYQLGCFVCCYSSFFGREHAERNHNQGEVVVVVIVYTRSF